MSAKSAKKYRERLEGSYRLIRIKKIKRGFYLIQLILAVVISSIVSYMMGMRFEPFFLPTDMFVFVMLIFGAALVGEGVYFRGMEMKYTKSKSRRFLIARNSIRSSAVLIVLSGILIILLFLPATDDYLSNNFEELTTNNINDATLHLDANDGVNNSLEFTIRSHPPMGLVKLDNLLLTLDTGTDLDIQVINNQGDPLIKRNINSDIENVYDLSSYSGSRADFTVIISNPEPVPVNGTYSYDLDYGMSNILKFFIPVVLMVIIIIQMVSISIMLPLREMYASSSIYSKHYVHEKEEGVERLSDRRSLEAQLEAEREAKRKADEAIFEESIDIATLESTVSPSKAEDAEPITKMGDLDAELDEEADVACPKCGEMNSPHAGMCFVCGNPMAVVKEEEIDINEILARGENSMQTGKFAQAGMFFDEVIKHDNCNERALLGKAMSLNAMGKWGMAVQYVNTVININPNNTDALLLKGQILEARGKPEMALDIYNRIMVIDPTIQIAIAKKKELSMEIEDMIIAAAAAQADDMPMAGEIIEEDEQDVVEAFMELPGIGLAKATALYEAGFTSMNKLRSASEDELIKVKGISSRLAKKIKG